MQMARSWGLLCVLGVCVASGAASAASRPRLAVIRLADNGVGPKMVESLGDMVAAAINRLGVFDVLTQADIEKMLAFEEQKQLLGCESDTSCVAELGGALGVAQIVTGAVGKVGSTYIINLTLIDTGRADVLAREQRTVSDPDLLPREIDGAARFVVRELLEARQGFLVLKVSEGTAEVEIDGKLVGMSPLARQTVASGPHRVRVSKDGFITWGADVDIGSDRATVVDVALVPSLELIRAHDRRATAWRVAAHVSAGVGSLALLGGTWAHFVYNAGRASDFNSEVRAAGCASGSTRPTVDCDADYGDRKRSIERVDLLSAASMILGSVALATSSYFYIQGPTPGIYDEYKPDDARADSGAALPAVRVYGGGVDLAWRF